MASPAIGTGTGNIQTANDTSTATGLTITAPSSAASGDLLVMALATSAARTVTATGWTSIGSVTQSVLGQEIEMFWRTHNGSGSYSVSWSGACSVVGTIVLVTGADTSSPIDVSATYNSAFTSATAQTAPTVTTTVADTLLLNFYGNSLGYTYTPASSQTEVSDVANGVSAELTKLAVASSGATGTKTSTCSSSTYWVSMSVAIKPAPAKPRSSVPMVIG